MPRDCGWCTSAARVDWERRVAAGEPVSVVSASTPFSTSAARRHLRLHLQPRLLSELRGADATVHLSDFADRLLELAQHAAGVRAFAAQTNNGRLALQANAEERANLVTLMARLGIDSTEAAELHGEARLLTAAVVAIVRSGRYPTLADDLADRLIRDGLNHLADALIEVRASSDPEKRELLQ